MYKYRLTPEADLKPLARLLGPAQGEEQGDFVEIPAADDVGGVLRPGRLTVQGRTSDNMESVT